MTSRLPSCRKTSAACPARALSAAPVSDPVPFLADAVKQYGLRIETRKGPIEMFAVTHIKKTPTDN